MVSHTPVGLAAVFQQVGRVRPVVAHVLKWYIVARNARAIWFGANVPVPVVAYWDEGEALGVGGGVG